MREEKQEREKETANSRRIEQQATHIARIKNEIKLLPSCFSCYSDIFINDFSIGDIHIRSLKFLLNSTHFRDASRETRLIRGNRITCQYQIIKSRRWENSLQAGYRKAFSSVCRSVCGVGYKYI